MRRYDPREIEPKWQKTWEEQGIYHATEDPAKPKRYVLEYFPYPSGAAMHVGHVRNYTIGDAIARFARMRGNNVLHPMGWDAFGLPAENYAIKTGVSPQEAIKINTRRFKEQLMQMGFSYDWTREINSTDPKYYKWTQWFFLLLHKRGLAYQQESLQWWCPHDKTVLANEQVEAGLCWRCGHAVEKKALKQWFFKITDYADRLEKDLDDVNWSEGIKTMQRNWIGRSKGAEINFAIPGHDDVLKVFTTRPDTLYGATFMVLAPEHPLVGKLTGESEKSNVEKYVKQAQAKSEIQRQETDREKTGAFTGSYAVNPANGEKIPVWVADYVLMGYGTGAIMAVPAHDERDNEFAKKFDLRIEQVVAPVVTDVNHPPRPDKDFTKRVVTMSIVMHPDKDEIITLRWDKLQWHTLVTGGVEEGEEIIASAEREIRAETGYKNIKFVSKLPYVINSHFYAEHKDVNRDVMMHVLMFQLEDLEKQATEKEEHEQFDVEWWPLKKIGELGPVSELDHIIRWLDNPDVVYSGEGLIINSDGYDGMTSDELREKIVADLTAKGMAAERVNYKVRDWLISRQRYWGAPIPIIHCPDHGAVPVPLDQLPVELPELKTFEPSGDGRSPLATVPEWVNTTCPVCGKPAQRETDTMDGFACSSWYFLRFADPHNDEMPFTKEKAEFWLPVDDYIGGAEHAVMHLLYARFWTKVMYDEGLINFQEPFTTLRNQGMILAPDGLKMSKSKGNTIEPDELINQGYGADSIRLMELFIGPWNQSANWSVEGMGGTFRFLQRTWTLVMEYKEHSSELPAHDRELLVATHKAIQRVSHDLEDLGLNTAVAALMEYVNALYQLKSGGMGGEAWQFAIKDLLQLLAPFAPHITEELWHELGREGSIHQSDWPVHDPQYLIADTITIAVQVNGKLRATVTVPANADKQIVLDAAKAKEDVKKYMTDGAPKKEIYVPGRLVNFVV